MDKIKKELNDLNNKLLKFARAYYYNDQSLVTDQEYDGLYNYFQKLVKSYPQLEPANSILKQIGYLKVDNRFQKIAHRFQMYSLSNAFNEGDIINFNKQIKDNLNVDFDLEYLVEPKIDGISISLIYNNKKLTRALTRGNGIVGEDVTHNVWEIASIPKIIEYSQPIEFRGEIYISKSDFKKLNRGEQQFANSRNAAAGSLRQLDSKIVAERKLNAFVYSIPNPLDHKIFTYKAMLDFIKIQGFKIPTVHKKTKGVKKLFTIVEEIATLRKKLDYEIDGIVIKLNDIKLWEDVGYTVKFPKYMIAYKLPAEIAKTTLLDIFPTIGRTGRVTYNAKLSPVQLAGTIVTAATLHNADYINEINANKNDLVCVKKAGEIIPKVLSVARKNNNRKWKEATNCPSCQKLLVRFPNEVDQYCTNQHCAEKKQALFKHFVSRNAMNIEGLSSENLMLFTTYNLIDDLPSIMALDSNYDTILALDRFQQKAATKITESIKKAKTVALDKFIFALGIRHVGSKTSTIIAKRFGTIKNVIEAKISDLESIHDIGPKVANSLLSFFKSPATQKMLDKFWANGVIVKPLETNISRQLNGETFVITGTLSKPRLIIKQTIEAHGGNLTNTISAKTSYLLVGKDAGSKLKKAQDLGTKIISENDFEKLLITKE